MLDEDDSITKTTTFSNSILVGTASSIDANSSYAGSHSLTYQAMHYTHSSESYSVSQRPSTIVGSVKSRECYTPLVTNQTTYSSTCTISRKYLFEPARTRPKYLAIEYPIVTTSTVGMITTPSWTPLGIGEIPLCSASVSESSNAGIPNPYLESIEIDGGTAGSSDYQIANYNYKSTNSYGLTRIHEIT